MIAAVRSLAQELKKQRSRSEVWQRNLFVWGSLVPILIFFAIFWVYPIFSALYISLNEWGLLTGRGSFVSLANYTWAWQDQLFWVSLRNTIEYAVLFVGSTMVISLIAALFVLSLQEPWKAILTIIFFIPTITSTTIAALTFEVLYIPSYGVFNYLLSFLGIDPIPWLTLSPLIMPSISFFMAWKYLGFYMVLFMTGLNAIPQQFIEAAVIDGANSWQVFWSVKLPLLKPTLTFNVVTGTIAAFQVFAPLYVLARSGGGRDAARTLVLHLYKQGFQFYDLGKASAIAYMLFVLILGLAIVQMRYMREQFEY